MEDLGHALLVPSSLAWKFVSEALQFLFLITHKTPLPHLGSSYKQIFSRCHQSPWPVPSGRDGVPGSPFSPVLISCCNKWSQTHWLKTTEIRHLTILGSDIWHGHQSRGLSSSGSSWKLWGQSVSWSFQLSGGCLHSTGPPSIFKANSKIKSAGADTWRAHVWLIGSFVNVTVSISVRRVAVMEKTPESPLDFKEISQSILKEINPEYSLEGLMLKLKLQYSGHLLRRADSLVKTLILRKIDGRRRRGWQRMRWLDDITNPVNITLSKLQSIGSQRVRHDSDWTTTGRVESGPLYFILATESVLYWDRGQSIRGGLMRLGHGISSFICYTSIHWLNYASILFNFCFTLK